MTLTNNMTPAVDYEPEMTGQAQVFLSRFAQAFDPTSEAQPAYKPNALTVFNKRYPRKDDHGAPTETPAEVHWRIAANVAAVTMLYVEGAQWQEGDPDPEIVDANRIPFPFSTAVRQYNWLNANGRLLKPFWAVVEAGFDAWLDQAKRYYNELLVPLVFVPNSPTWTGAGTPLRQLAACFVLPINDSLIAGPASIMQTLTDAVAIQKTGGGNGFSFGRLRRAGSTVSTSMGQATGVVGFLSMLNDVFEHIRQGGSRRGANMGVCPDWHPDVIEFINSKVIEGKIANFNISVAVSDRLMEAVMSGGVWQLREGGPDGAPVEFTWEGKIVKEVPAIDFFNLITTNAHVIGDPGSLFIDTANRDNPCPMQYRYESTNPCGEQWLEPYGNCCLGTVAIQQFVREDGTFDWAWFDRVFELAAEFLDDVVDANGYVPAVPKLEWAAQNGRRIGLGQMGVADALVKLGLRYASRTGLDFVSQNIERMRFIAMRTSIRRAAERGPFPWIPFSMYDGELLERNDVGAQLPVTMVDEQGENTLYLWKPPTRHVPHERDFGCPTSDWDEITAGIIASGIRNCCQTTFVPTGTVASTAGVEGYGCEPMFALNFVRTMMQEGENILLDYPSDLFAAALAKAGLTEAQMLDIAAKVKRNEGSCQGIMEVPEAIREIFVVASDLSGTEHVAMQAALQAFIDNSISKTINFPNSATVEDVREAYLAAYTTGCKGITVYRNGSRELEVLSTKMVAETSNVEVLDQDHWPIIRPLPIPTSAADEGLPSRTFSVQTPFGKMRATVTQLPGHPDRPFDVQVSIGRGGNDVNSFAEALGRMFSWGLRLGGDVRDGADYLIGIGGTTQERTLRPDRSLSLPDAFGKLMLSWAERNANVQTTQTPARDDNYVADTTKLCPECRQASLTFQQGCSMCITPGCGYSAC